jgi:hypothetical protein
MRTGNADDLPSLALFDDCLLVWDKSRGWYDKGQFGLRGTDRQEETDFTILIIKALRHIVESYNTMKGTEKYLYMVMRWEHLPLRQQSAVCAQGMALDRV